MASAVLPATQVGPDTPATLTRDQAAKYLGVSTRHLERLARAGKAPAPIRLGHRVLWVRATLEEWIKRLSTK